MNPEQLKSHKETQDAISALTKTNAKKQALERATHTDFQKKLRERAKTTLAFKVFLEEPTFNLKVFQLRERLTPPTPEEVKNILGNITNNEVNSFCYEILPRFFKHWGQTNDYSYQMKVLQQFQVIEE
jgi:hypothetical protein